MDSHFKTPANPSVITYPSCGLATPIFNDITYTTHIQTVYLKAIEPPSFLQHAIHWTVSSTHGVLPEIDPQDNATYLGTLPGRIVTVSMLHRSYCRQIMTALLLAWIYALSCRFLRPRRAIWRPNAINSSLLVLLAPWFNYINRLELCMTMVAGAAASCGGSLDAVGMLAALIGAHKGWNITAIILTVAHAVWAKDSRKIDREPDFATFLARLRPAPLDPNISGESEKHRCFLCLSSEDTLFTLPCHPSHRACKKCLLELYDLDKPHCLHCKTLLYIEKSRSERDFLRYHIATNVVLAYTFGSILAAIWFCKGHYWFATGLITFMLCCLGPAWWLLCWLGSEWVLVDVPITSLLSTLGIAAYFAWVAGVHVQTWDQVTLWDGAVLKGVEVWDTYEVVREWYGAATPV
jgi:hypothetical protein